MRAKWVLVGSAVLAAACGGGEESDAPAADAAATPAPAAAAAEAPAQDDNGATVYGNICVTCHQADGAGLQGAFPPLAGSAVAIGDPAVPIKVVLHGLTGPMTRGTASYSGMMTPWGATLSDKDIADVLTYVRSNFGNSADPVSEEQVAEIRAATSSQTAPYTTEELGISN